MWYAPSDSFSGGYIVARLSNLSCRMRILVVVRVSFLIEDRSESWSCLMSSKYFLLLFMRSIKILPYIIYILAYYGILRDTIKCMDVRDLQGVMGGLGRKRGIFHAEADFQFALALEIMGRWPEADVRLERPFGSELNKYLDILVRVGGRVYPIEVKYLTRQTEPRVVEIDGERFCVKTQAPSLDSYHCLKDIQRIEGLAGEEGFGTGFVIWLSNDDYFWAQSRRSGREISAEDFRIQDGMVKTGRMEWRAGAKTEKSYEKPLELRGRYAIKWQPYGTLSGDIKNGEFRYVLLAIDVAV